MECRKTVKSVPKERPIRDGTFQAFLVSPLACCKNLYAFERIVAEGGVKFEIFQYYTD